MYRDNTYSWNVSEEKESEKSFALKDGNISFIDILETSKWFHGTDLDICLHNHLLETRNIALQRTSQAV